MAERNLSYVEAVAQGLVVPSRSSKKGKAIYKSFMSEYGVDKNTAQRAILKPESWWNARYSSDLQSSYSSTYLERARQQLKGQSEKVQREKARSDVATQRLSRVTGGLIGGEAGGAAASSPVGSLPALGVSGSGGLADETMLGLRKKLK
jgi:hypothetical protein